MSGPPRNPELERMLIDVLRATSHDSPDRHAAWEVYADWLLGVGEPVGEWLAASLRADDDADAAAPIRAQLGEIETATRFRLVDNDLADLSEVPELTRIAEFTWERGFITTAAFRTRAFRPWDLELLGHTPDHLLDVVLRSPSSRLLHTLELDNYAFPAKGSRYGEFLSLLRALPEPLPLRTLRLGNPDAMLRTNPDAFARMPELTELALEAVALRVEEPVRLPKLASLRVRVGALSQSNSPRPGRPQEAQFFGLAHINEFRALIDDEAALPSLRALELACVDAGKSLVDVLLASPLRPQLEQLHIEYADEALVSALSLESAAFTHVGRRVLSGPKVSPHAMAALRECGWVVASSPA